jgi:hypothetical protein
MSRDPLDVIRAELAKLEARPGLAKASVDPRAAHRSKVHAAFCAGVDFLLLEGWSRRAIAEHMDAHVTTLIGWYEHGDSKRDQLPAWALAALPAAARPAVMRVMLGWSDTPPARTGTDG